MILDAIKTLKEYIKVFSKKRGYKKDVENAKTLLNQYEKKQNTIETINKKFNNL